MDDMEISETQVRADLAGERTDVLVAAAQAVFAAAARVAAAYDDMEALAVEQAADSGLSALRPLRPEWPPHLAGEGQRFAAVLIELLAAAAAGLGEAARSAAEPSAVLCLHRAADDARATAEALNAFAGTAA